jgi:Astacin (Peptidase family M12A)
MLRMDSVRSKLLYILTCFNKLYSAQSEMDLVAESLQEIEAQTCLVFVERSTEDDYIEIINGGGCSSSLGRIGGKQKLSLNRDGCFTKGTILHEFIHALG